MYTETQMKMICQFKLKGYEIKYLLSDNKLEIYAHGWGKEVLLFVVSAEEHIIDVALLVV